MTLGQFCAAVGTDEVVCKGCIGGTILNMLGWIESISEVFSGTFRVTIVMDVEGGEVDFVGCSRAHDEVPLLRAARICVTLAALCGGGILN